MRQDSSANHAESARAGLPGSHAHARPAQAGDAGVQVITRAAAILRALRGHRDGLSLSRIAATAGLPRSTVHRLAGALLEEGLLEAASPDGGLRLGPEIARLAQDGQAALRERLHPFLELLSSSLEETVDCALLEADRLRLIDQIPAPHRLRAVSAIGASFPLHCTANGKAALAQLDRATVIELLPARLERHTPNTITRRKSLLRELDRVGRDGVAFDREEHTIGICAAGIAFTDGPGRIAAISVPTPAQRFTGHEGELALELSLVRELIVAEL